jgi:hypothetical protein
MNDTSPEFAEIYRSRLMALPAEERLAMASRSFDVARRVIVSSFPPGLSEREYKRLLYERTYGEPAPEGFPS